MTYEYKEQAQLEGKAPFQAITWTLMALIEERKRGGRNNLK